MELRELGEFGLIGAIRRRAARDTRGSSVWRVAIGDDAAVLTPKSGEEIVVTADALVEDVHFRWKTTDARSLGHKTLAVNLSDVGAMGARPLGFLLTLALPPDAESARLDGFFDGLLGLARASGCPLVGGDVVRSPVWSLGVTALGAVARGRALLRSGARAGDRLFVTGELGGAAAGLRLLEGPVAFQPAQQRLVKRQLAPDPPWRVGPKLVRARLAHAAIDVSDGLGQDLGHLCEESGVGAAVELERLPLARGLAAAAARLGADPIELALGGGEDYELLFAAPARAPSAAVFAKRLGCRVTEIGVTTARRAVVFTRGGRRVEANARGFQHFSATLRDSDK